MNKFLIALFVSLCGMASFAQAPLNLETTANGITQNWAAGDNVTRGQILKFSGSQVVPVATTDTSGAMGIAITSGSSGQSVLVSVMGSPLIQVDGACTQGNFINISPTNKGFGHCTTTSSGQLVGTALNTIGAAGFVGVQLTSLTTSGGSSGGGLDNTVNPLSFGAKFDVKFVYDAAATSGSPIVTCPNLDCNFTSADVGKIVFGSNSSNIASAEGSGLYTGQNTIIAVNNANSITMSANATANCAIVAAIPGTLCTLAWGSQDDATAINSAAAAAWGTQGAACKAVQLPSGSAFIGTSVINQQIAALSSACGGTLSDARTSGIDTTQTGPEIYGQGPGNSILIPLPNFDFTSCTTGATTHGCNLTVPNLEAHDFGINGLGNIVPTPHTVNLVSLEGSSGGGICTGSTGFNLTFSNWAESSAGSQGFVAGNNSCGDPYYSNIVSEMFGATNCNFVSGGLNVNFVAVTCFGATAQVLVVSGPSNGIVNSSMGQYVDMLASGPLVTHSGGVTWNSQQEFFSGNVSVGSLVVSTYFNNCTGSCSAYFDKAFIGANVSAPTGQLFNLQPSGGTLQLHLRNSKMVNQNNANNREFFSNGSSSQIFDDGGNTWTGAGGTISPSVFAGSTFSADNRLKGSCTGVATASSTLGLYGTGPNVTLTTCTSTTIGAGVPMQGSRTLYGLNVTATAAGVNASSGVVTVLKNGGATTITCTIGTGTSCNDFVHSVSVVDGDLISIQFTSQAADTLAGVKAVADWF